MKGAGLWTGGFSSLECFVWDGSVFQFLLEVHFPVKSHLLPYFRLGEAIIRDLFYVVYHAVQEPLDIYFDFSPKSKPVKALLSSDVGKDGFGHGEPLWVNLPPPFTINLAGHSLGKVGEFYPDGYPEISFFPASSGQTPQMQRAALTILFLGHIYSAHQTISVGFFRYPSESFALRALVVIGGLLVMKIL